MHNGTHLDAPFHSYAVAVTIDHLPLAAYTGPAHFATPLTSGCGVPFGAPSSRCNSKEDLFGELCSTHLSTKEVFYCLLSIAQLRDDRGCRSLCSQIG